MTAKASIHLNLYATGDKFCSVAGQWPKTAETWQEYDSGSEARGAGWRNIDFALNSAVQLLYLIEYASFQSQAMIGAGRTGFFQVEVLLQILISDKQVFQSKTEIQQPSVQVELVDI